MRCHGRRTQRCVKTFSVCATIDSVLNPCSIAVIAHTETPDSIAVNAEAR